MHFLSDSCNVYKTKSEAAENQTGKSIRAKDSVNKKVAISLER
jgi:hypothetical protein